MSIFLAEETNDFFSASLNYVWGIVRRKSLHYDIEDHLGRFAACHQWYMYHTQPLLDKSVSWPSAQEMERNGLGIFFHTLTSRICHLQLGTLFHNRPTVSELESLAASLLLTWKDPLYVRLSRQEILREDNIFLYCQIWQNFRPTEILHLEYLLLLHVSSTSPWALTNLRSWPSLLLSVRNQPPEIKVETLRERTNYI